VVNPVVFDVLKDRVASPLGRKGGLNG